MYLNTYPNLQIPVLQFFAWYHRRAPSSIFHNLITKISQTLQNGFGNERVVIVLLPVELKHGASVDSKFNHSHSSAPYVALTVFHPRTPGGTLTSLESLCGHLEG